MDEKICGLLHDLIADTNWTFEKLKAEGYPDHIVEALTCLTKKNEEEPYEDFIMRVTLNKLAISVKINDLIDNLDVKRYETITEREVKRINKYLKWYRYLTELDAKQAY